MQVPGHSVPYKLDDVWNPPCLCLTPTSLSDLAVLRGAPLGFGSHSSQRSDLCWLPTHQDTELSHIPPLGLGKCPPPIFKKLFFPLSMEPDGLESAL